MADAVHYWIVNGVGLRKERSPDGGQWRELCELEDTSEVDDEVWSPSHKPERDCHQGNFGEFALSALGAVLNRSQGCHVHLFRLFSHILLMSGNRFQDEVVRVYDHQEWEEVHPSAVHDDV